MRKARGMVGWVLAAIFSAAVFSPVVGAQQQPQNFTPVEGANLQAKLDAASRQASTGGRQSSYWSAYSFDVRPGVAVDFESVGDDGSLHNVYIENSFVFALGSNIETRNLGIFLLRAPDTNTITRIEVFNLDRRREYSGYPVYWLGRAANEESLNLLRGVAEAGTTTGEMARSATRAIALHDDRRVDAILEAFARSSSNEKVRTHSIFWLGQGPASPTKQALLLELARNEQESTEVRRSAISAFGQTRDAQTLTALINLYASVSQEELKRRILSSIAANDNIPAAANFLLRVASTDTESRKKIISYLSEMAVRQLEGKATPRRVLDDETELQMQAIVALSRRPSEEAVPLLIRHARTHPKTEVRRQALRMLGSLGKRDDGRVLEFFREVLAK